MILVFVYSLATTTKYSLVVRDYFRNLIKRGHIQNMVDKGGAEH